jgi:hypothetical protein
MSKARPAMTERVRIGDRERAAVAERLSAHAADGRLSIEELETRLERANAAVFADELRSLEADLPGRREVVAPRRPPVPVAPLAAIAIAVAVATTLAAGHPVLPPLLLAFVLWRVAWRRPAAGRSLP